MMVWRTNWWQTRQEENKKAIKQRCRVARLTRHQHSSGLSPGRGVSFLTRSTWLMYRDDEKQTSRVTPSLLRICSDYANLTGGEGNGAVGQTRGPQSQGRRTGQKSTSQYSRPWRLCRFHDTATLLASKADTNQNRMVTTARCHRSFDSTVFLLWISIDSTTTTSTSSKIERMTHF